MLLDTQKPGTIQRGKDGSAYVGYAIAALWPAGGDCGPGHPGDTLAHALCHPACPWWLAPRLRPRSSQDCAQSRTRPGTLFTPADLLLGLAHLLARIPCEPGPDLAACSRPGPGDHDRPCRCRPYYCRPLLAGGLCLGSRGLAHRRCGCQCDRTEVGPSSPDRERDRGREYGQ